MRSTGRACAASLGVVLVLNAPVSSLALTLQDGSAQSVPRRAFNCGFPKADPRTLDESWARVPFVVVGEVVSTARGLAELLKDPRFPLDSSYRPVIESQVRVVEVLKEGGPLRSSPQIRVVALTQTTRVGESTMEIRCSSDPELLSGQRHVLFLYWSDDFHSYTVAGRTGSLEIQNDRVILNDASRRLDIAGGRSEMPADELLSALRRLGAVR